jgi:hypothetical protein
MRILTLFTCFFVSTCIASSQKDCYRYKIDYVPKDLHDAIMYLDCKWNVDIKKEFKSKDESEAVSEMHMGVGRSIRNSWGLWEKKRNSLVRYFNKLGIFHPDDMSSIIFTSFHRKLNNREIDINSQVKEYKDYWVRAKLSQESLESIWDKEIRKDFNSFEIGDTVKIEYKKSVQGKNVWIYRIQNYPDLNEIPDCFVTGVVKGKQRKSQKKGNYILKIFILDICGYNEAIISGLDEKFRVGELYKFFSLDSYKIKK